MSEWMWWAIIALLFFGPMLLPLAWRRFHSDHTDGFKGDGGAGDIERARAMGHSQMGGGWGGGWGG